MTLFEDPYRCALRIDRVGLVVADLDAAKRFYAEALGFSSLGLAAREGQVFGGKAITLRLGEQILELVQVATPGAPYPEPRAANDPWFQHLAIAVSDMDRAFAQLSAFGFEPISTGGPQRLPASTGDVTAYKFRDPDGHPLELSYAPHSQWVDPAHAQTDHPTLGIDHSALAVANLAVSVAFYTEGLGLRLGPPALNQGPEQARLDGLGDPVVDIAVLKTRDPGPHLELLHYRTPRSARPPRTVAVDDIAATRLVMQVDALDLVAERAMAWGGTPVSAERVAGRIFLRDPDGHLLELVETDV